MAGWAICLSMFSPVASLSDKAMTFQSASGNQLDG